MLTLYSCATRKAIPDLRETYNYKDRNPFGGYAAFEIVKETFPNHNIKMQNLSWSEGYEHADDTASLYLSLSKNFYINSSDADQLMQYVYRGNTAFIAASYIDSNFLKKLFCEQRNTERRKYEAPDYSQTSLRLINALSDTTEKYGYYYYPFSNSFPEINSNYARIAGYNDFDQVNFFVFFWGKGRFYLHADPRAFSNYFLLTKNNYKYLQRTLSMFPENPENIYWDNYYNKRNADDREPDDFSSFSGIMKYPPLKAAFFIVLGMLLLYVFFNSKRRQRVVPVIKKTDNTSIAFAQAVAGLYLKEKDNRIIAEKIITYFNDRVRTKYFISLAPHEALYASTLSAKSGVAVEDCLILANMMIAVQEGEKITDNRLMEVNRLVEKFY